LIRALNQFQRNLLRVRQMGSLYHIWRSKLKGALDLSDLLRAELVLSVSLLDHFVHEIVRIGMLEIFEGKRSKTKAYSKFEKSLQSFLARRFAPMTSVDFDLAIRKRNESKTFQRPWKIEEAIGMVFPDKLWPRIVAELGTCSIGPERHLNLVVDRRNRIAHEADTKPTGMGALWAIDEGSVSLAVDSLQQLVEAIYKVVN